MSAVRAYRIAAEHEQEIHFARGHVGGQVANRLHVVDRRGIDGFRIHDGRADVAERLVHQVRERVDRRRLRFTRDDQARAAVLLQILGNREDAIAPALRCRHSAQARAADAGGDRAGDRRKLGRTSRKPVIGLRAGQRRHRFDRVEPVHAVRVLGTPARDEIACVAQPARTGAEQIGIEGQDDVGAFDVILRIDVLAQGDLRPETGVVPAGRVPLVPSRERQPSQQILNLRRQRRRIDRFGEDAHAGALQWELGDERRAHRAQKRGPRADFADVRQGPHAMGIVEPEDRGLREHVSRPQARRMHRIAFDLGRPPFVALDQQARRRSADAHRRREEERFAQDQFFGLFDVGDDLSSGWRVQAVSPASAIDAPMSFMNVRRVVGSVIASTSEGNSL